MRCSNGAWYVTSQTSNEKKRAFYFARPIFNDIVPFILTCLISGERENLIFKMNSEKMPCLCCKRCVKGKYKTINYNNIYWMKFIISRRKFWYDNLSARGGEATGKENRYQMEAAVYRKRGWSCLGRNHNYFELYETDIRNQPSPFYRLCISRDDSAYAFRNLLHLRIDAQSDGWRVVTSQRISRF